MKFLAPVQQPTVIQGSIHVQKFLEIHCDGVKDPDEPGFNGVAITLNGPCGPFVLVIQDMNMERDRDTARILDSGGVWPVPCRAEISTTPAVVQTAYSGSSGR